MKRVLLSTLAFVFVLSVGFVAIQDAEIKFQEESWDFGKVKEGVQATHVFEFTNTGDKGLLLNKVQPSCGCTASDHTKEVIKPGETGYVKAIYNSKGRVGIFTKSIKVHYANEDGSNPREMTLTIKGNVLAAESDNQSPVIVKPRN